MGSSQARRTRLAVLGVSTVLAGANLAAPALASPVPAAGAPPARTVAMATNSACTTLASVVRIVTEPLAVAAGQSGSFVPLQANGWTVFAPSDAWKLSASDAGADVNSPSGQDASLITWYSLGVPWTMKTLGAKFYGQLTHVHVLCQTAVARSASGQSQASELTGFAGPHPLRAVLIDSILTPTTETDVGESRYLYTPAAQWSAANARTLALIIRRAIQSPQSLG